MKALPLTNIEKFEKSHCNNSVLDNCELFFWTGMLLNTHHCHFKNEQLEGIGIIWKGNPFGLVYYHDLILKK